MNDIVWRTKPRTEFWHQGCSTYHRAVLPPTECNVFRFDCSTGYGRLESPTEQKTCAVGCYIDSGSNLHSSTPTKSRILKSRRTSSSFAADSSTVTLWPALAMAIAAARPPRPAPTTITDRPCASALPTTFVDAAPFAEWSSCDKKSVDRVGYYIVRTTPPRD